MPITFAVLALLLLALSPNAVPAQEAGAPWPVAARDDGAVMYRVAEGVYAIVHQRATEEWPHGNTGVIVGRDAVLVIDSNYLPARAVDDIALIRQVTRTPVRYLVNTHWHGDHTHGNGVYRDSFPGLTIVGPQASAGFTALNLLKLPIGYGAPDSDKRKRLAELEAQLARGRDTSGRDFTTAEREALTKNVAERRHELAELAKVAVVPPNLRFHKNLTLDLSGRIVELRDMGRANSPADVTIYLPAERVLFTGDILVHPLPYTGLTSPLPWISVLREVETWPVAALVPGHGPVMRNHNYTRLVRETLDAIRGQIDSLFQRGFFAQAAAAKVDVSDLRRRFLDTDGQPVSLGAWEGFTRSLATSMAQCVQGYSC